MTRINGETDRPGHLRMMQCNPVIFENNRLGSAVDVMSWARGDLIFPPAVSVAPQLDQAAPTVEEWNKGMHGQLWRWYTAEFEGWGWVTVAGQAGVGTDDQRVIATASPMGPTTDFLVSLTAGRPRSWEWATDAQAAVLFIKRLGSMLLGLSAYAYLHNPELWGGQSSVMNRWAREWVRQDGRPVIHSGMGLDLRDPLTWQ